MRRHQLAAAAAAATPCANGAAFGARCSCRQNIARYCVHAAAVGAAAFFEHAQPARGLRKKRCASVSFAGPTTADETARHKPHANRMHWRLALFLAAGGAASFRCLHFVFQIVYLVCTFQSTTMACVQGVLSSHAFASIEPFPQLSWSNCDE